MKANAQEETDDVLGPDRLRGLSGDALLAAWAELNSSPAGREQLRQSGFTATQQAEAAKLWTAQSELWPLPPETVRSWEQTYSRCCARAVPLKDSGNEAFRAGDYAEALARYDKALSQFPHALLTGRSLYPLALAAVHERSGSRSSVALLRNAFIDVGPLIAECLGVRGHGKGDCLPMQRMAAECAGNASAAALKCEKADQALQFAKMALALDKGYSRALGRMAAATKAGAVEISNKVQASMSKGKLIKEFKYYRGLLDSALAQFRSEVTSVVFAGTVTELPDIAELDQVRAMRLIAEVKAARAAVTQLPHVTVSLEISLVPMKRGERRESGQWLHVTMHYVDSDWKKQARPGLHFAEADNTGGDAVDRHHPRNQSMMGGLAFGGPEGVSTEKAKLFSEKRIPALVELLKANGIRVANATLGQGIMYLADEQRRAARGLAEGWPGCMVMRTMV